MNLEALSLWSLGALFGLRHAFEPDHLAAVSALVTQRPGARTALGIGAAWGLGHTLALLAVASTLAIVRGKLPPPVTAGLELVVGVILILLGAQSLQRARAVAREQAHARAHAVEEAVLPPALGGARWKAARRSVLVGVAHGLAGSGAITALIAAQFPSFAGRVAYVAVFGLGSTLGMAGLSGLAGGALARAARRPVLRPILAVAGGVLAIGVGAVWVAREVRALWG